MHLNLHCMQLQTAGRYIFRDDLPTPKIHISTHITFQIAFYSVTYFYITVKDIDVNNCSFSAL